MQTHFFPFFLSIYESMLTMCSEHRPGVPSFLDGIFYWEDVRDVYPMWKGVCVVQGGEESLKEKLHFGIVRKFLEFMKIINLLSNFACIYFTRMAR